MTGIGRHLMSSKPSYPSEEADSRILRGYCGSWKFTIWPKLYLGSDPSRGGRVPRTNDRRSRCQGERLRTTLSSALQDFNGKINVLVKAISKQPPEGDVSGMGLSGKQGARLDQGECVHFVLNAPANVQVRLMRKDVWTV